MWFAVLSSWCVPIFVIYRDSFPWWVVMNVYVTGLLPFLDIDEVSVPLIYWNRGVLSG